MKTTWAVVWKLTWVRMILRAELSFLLSIAFSVSRSSTVRMILRAELSFLSGGSTSEAVITRKVGQPYLLKSSWKKKYTDWNIQKILFFVIENKGYRVD